MKNPAEVARGYLTLGKIKTEQTAVRLLLLGMLAGAFIALAGAAATFGNVYVGKVAGAAIFPAGLTMVVLAGSELFTGNCLLIYPLLEREICLRALLCSWALVYLGNFLGSVLVAGLCSAAGTLDVVRDAVITTAEMKASLPFGAALLRGVLRLLRYCQTSPVPASPMFRAGPGFERSQRGTWHPSRAGYRSTSRSHWQARRCPGENLPRIS